MERLTCHVKDYDWGGDASCLVARYATSGGHAPPPAGRPFAELWVGSHRSGAARKTDGTDIGHLNLPYLLKVLSINKALSIQVHPCRSLAARLHRDHPLVYTDPNHKPEIAIPLTPFEALAGLRTDAVLDRFPELSHMTCFEDLLDVSSDVVRAVVDRLLSSQCHCPEEILVLRLHEQFPYDLGVLSPLFLEYHRLEPGQSLFIPPGCPHAYLSGDIVECMSSSDNVIRCGLTHKLIDKATLREALDRTARCRVSDSTSFGVEGEFAICMKPPRPTLLLQENALAFCLESGCAWIAPTTGLYKLPTASTIIVESTREGVPSL